jgi:tetratricopeptide (TPR) repeat protein
MIIPTELAGLYALTSIDPITKLLPACIVLGSLSVIAIKHRHDRPWLMFGWIWFLVTLLPVIGLLQVGYQSHADRYMYLPSVGLLLAAGAEFTSRNIIWQGYSRFLSGILLAFYMVMAWIQVGYWANPHIFYSRILDLDPSAFQAHIGLSNYYLNRGDLVKAQEHGNYALENNGKNHFVYAILGNISMDKGDIRQAEKLYREALKYLPNYPEVLHNLGLTLQKQGRLKEAQKYFQLAEETDRGIKGIRRSGT